MPLNPETTRRGGRALLGLIACLVGPFAWAATVESPFLRSTGAAMWLCFAIGLASTLGAARRDRRWLVRVVVVLELAWIGLAAFAQFELSKLPGRAPAVALERAPDFELPDHPALLSDPGRTAIAGYGLVHADAAGTGADLAIPAQILVRPDGRVAWSHVSRRIQDRADPVETLAAVEALAGRPQ
jgi:hypothetical protein